MNQFPHSEEPNASSQSAPHREGPAQDQLNAQEPSGETQSPRPAGNAAAGRQRSVFQYITVLFAAAFFLLLLTFLMERRSSQAEMDSLRGDSASALESVQNMMAENQELKETLNTLTSRVEYLEEQERSLQDQLNESSTQAAVLERQVRAMELLLELERAYSGGRYTTARSVIADIQDQALESSLPDTNAADPESPSPLERYHTIRDALGVS